MLATRSVAIAVVLAILACATVAHAQIAVSASDNKVVNVNGVVKTVPNSPPDTVTILDLKVSPPRTIAEVEAPVSVIGPPLSVAITPDERLALVTAAMRIDPSDPTKQTADTRMSVIDLKSSPPKVIATLEAGKSPSGLSINRQGTLALVANREDGTVSIFTIQSTTVTPAGSILLGDAKSGPAHVAIAPDGKTALVSRGGDHKVSVLSIDGTKVEHAKRDMSAGVRPGALDIVPSGAWAVVGNLGGGQGDADTVSLIDLKAKPPRVVDTISVGALPEGVKASPDGMHVAVVVHNGSNRPKESPFFNDYGKLVLLRVSGTTLAKVAEGRIGHWSQGVAFSADGKTILVGNMVEKDYWVFEWNGTVLRDTGVRIAVKGGPAAIRTADK